MILKNKTHVVFGDSASRNSFLQNEELTTLLGTVISMNQDFTIGPITELKEEQGRVNRENWLKSIFRNTSDVLLIPVWREDFAKVKTLKALKPNDTLYIWMGRSSSEILATAYLLFELRNSKLDIHITDLSKAMIDRGKNDFYHASCLGVTRPEDIHFLTEYFQVLKDSKLQSWVSLWKKMVSDRKVLRTLIDGVIESVEENYFDETLQSNCSKQLQPSAVVVAKSLVEIDFHLSDYAINWRLKELIKQETLAIQGEPLDLRNYQIKLA